MTKDEFVVKHGEPAWTRMVKPYQDIAREPLSDERIEALLQRTQDEKRLGLVRNDYTEIIEILCRELQALRAAAERTAAGMEKAWYEWFRTELDPPEGYTMSPPNTMWKEAWSRATRAAEERAVEVLERIMAAAPPDVPRHSSMMADYPEWYQIAHAEYTRLRAQGRP